ncbi:hypothetical protein K402DRAFT_324649 [Aulographum hederae CBS 113979]|uniref:Uncharacterized protein n=1 Tax=Aulographum hederae CBS 113979 TaxID=1176131 RepID=A0A6G1HBW8_9PEZI|nr:hypothetical protein K402DRAFT_324649 [Aulographum hederae CBS 113979]
MSRNSPQLPSSSSPLLPSVFSHDDQPAAPEAAGESEQSHHLAQSPSSHPRSGSVPSVQVSPALRDDLEYIPPGDEDDSLLPPPNFQPFFSLIEDTATGEHHHPSIFYVFADDDPDIITAASRRALEPSRRKSQARTRTHSASSEIAVNEGDDDDEEEDDGGPLPPPRPGTKERFVILDLATSGDAVTSAQSLAPEWAITDANVCGAPTFADDASPGDGGLMLKVAGQGIPVKDSKGGRKRVERTMEEARLAHGGDMIGAMRGVLKGLEKQFDELERVVGDERDESTLIEEQD